MQDKLPVCRYLWLIILYSITVRDPTSEYFTIRKYSDICTIISQIVLHFYKHVTNVSNILERVSIDTKQYTCQIHAYSIEYFSIALPLVSVGRALLISSLTSTNTLIGCLSRLQFWQSSETLLYPSIVLSLYLQAMLFREKYWGECHIH